MNSSPDGALKKPDGSIIPPDEHCFLTKVLAVALVDFRHDLLADPSGDFCGDLPKAPLNCFLHDLCNLPPIALELAMPLVATEDFLQGLLWLEVCCLFMLAS